MTTVLMTADVIMIVMVATMLDVLATTGTTEATK